MTDNHEFTLGTLMRGLRNRNNWTLKEMSQKSGIPISTLSKVEHDRLTLTYDKLQQLSQRLNIRMSELFAEGNANATPSAVMGRRSIGTLENALQVTTPNYDYYYLSTELRQKRMIPVITHIRAKTLDEFGALVRHPGEEFVYVVEGTIVIHTEFYDPVVLKQGQSIYLDSTMGHAYVVGEGYEEAVVIGVMASAEDDLMTSLMTIFGEAAPNQSNESKPQRRATVRAGAQSEKDGQVTARRHSTKRRVGTGNDKDRAQD